MAVPKKQITRTRSGNRRGQIKMKKMSLSACPKCHALIIPHRVCPECGTYRGRDYSSKSTLAPITAPASAAAQE